MRLKAQPFFLLLGLFVLASCMQTKEFQNNTYQKVDGQWYLVNEADDQKTPIINNTITLKYSDNVDAAQIKEFETSSNLTLVRKAKTGWHDYEISEEADVFDKANELMQSKLVAQLEIPTGGSYLPSNSDAY